MFFFLFAIREKYAREKENRFSFRVEKEEEEEITRTENKRRSSKGVEMESERERMRENRGRGFLVLHYLQTLVMLKERNSFAFSLSHSRLFDDLQRW